MTFEEYRSYDALGLAELVKNKSITPSELLELAKSRLNMVNPKINAVIHKSFDMATNMADALKYDEVFAGVPFLIKEIGIMAKGLPFRISTKVLKDFIAEEDSYTTTKLRRAGLLFLGTTNLPELGLTPYTEPDLFGATLNPWNLSHTPGGSSGGSAAAVAAGICPIASANDGGGSIRIPASCSGLVGMKPSRARSSYGPFYGELWSGAVVEGSLSRSVRDSAAYLDLISAEMPGELYYANTQKQSYLSALNNDPEKLKIGFSFENAIEGLAHKDCQNAVLHTAKVLESLGHNVEEVKIPFERDDFVKVFYLMVIGETSAQLRELSVLLGKKITINDVETDTWGAAMMGEAFTATDFAYAKRQWYTIAKRQSDFHKKYDVLLTPVLAEPPAKIGALKSTKAEKALIKISSSLKLGKLGKSTAEKVAAKLFSYMPYPPIANMTGQPAISLPMYWNDDNLPIGSMLTGRMGEEFLLYQLAGQLERAEPWMKKIAMPTLIT